MASCLQETHSHRHCCHFPMGPRVGPNGQPKKDLEFLPVTMGNEEVCFASGTAFSNWCHLNACRENPVLEKLVTNSPPLNLASETEFSVPLLKLRRYKLQVRFPLSQPPSSGVFAMASILPTCVFRRPSPATPIVLTVTTNIVNMNHQNKSELLMGVRGLPLFTNGLGAHGARRLIAVLLPKRSSVQDGHAMPSPGVPRVFLNLFHSSLIVSGTASGGSSI